MAALPGVVGVTDYPALTAGYQDVSNAPESLRYALMQTPTGNNLLLGSDVEYVFDSDPTGTVGSWPEGARGIWVDGSDIRIGRFLRATGWKSAVLS